MTPGAGTPAPVSHADSTARSACKSRFRISQASSSPSSGVLGGQGTEYLEGAVTTNVTKRAYSGIARRCFEHTALCLTGRFLALVDATARMPYLGSQ